MAKIGGKNYIDREKDIPKVYKNKPFYQLTKGASFDFLRNKMMENSKAMGLWWELVNLMDNQNAVMVSQKTLSEFFGASRQTINSWTKWLEENSLIDIFKVGTANVYAVNAAIISDQLVTQKQHFALFNARVVAEKSEQTKKIQKKHYSVAQQVIRQHNIFGGIDEITSEFEKKP